MSLSFEPSRSSTPPRPRWRPSSAQHGANTTHTSLATSTSTTLPLSALTPAHIEILNDIVSRVPDATGFTLIFDAYKTVLQERGLDQDEDVIFYGFLLKLGVVKGKDWATRWESVKADLKASSLLISWNATESDDSEASLEENPQKLDTPRPAQRMSNAPSKGTGRYSSTGVQIRTPGIDTRSTALSAPLPAPALSNSDSSFETDEHSVQNDETGYAAAISSSKAPSYRTFATSVPESSGPVKLTPNLATKASTASSETRLTSQPLSHLERGVNGHDYWEVQDMERDADDHRDENLIRSCYNIWRNGVQWSATLLYKVGLERDKLTTRHFLFRWVSAKRKQDSAVARVVWVDETRRLRFAFRTWQTCLEEKRTRALRDGARRRYSLVKHSVNERIKRDTFRQWCHTFRLTRMITRSNQFALHHALSVWYERYDILRQMHAQVATFHQRTHRCALREALRIWSRQTSLNQRERIVVRTANSRLAGFAWDLWSRETRLHTMANQFQAKYVLKRPLAVWRKRMSHIKTLAKRANTEVHKRHRLLLRVAWRLWVIHEKGALYERIKLSQSALSVIRTWKRRLDKIKELEDKAISLAHRIVSDHFRHSFTHWRTINVIRTQHTQLAAKLYRQTLLVHAFQTWRVRKRGIHEQVKRARYARRWFLKREAWSIWCAALEGRKRMVLLGIWETKRKAKIVEYWRGIMHRKRRYQAMLTVMQAQQRQRMLSTSLRDWTLRTVELRDRQLQVAQVTDTRLLRASMLKWAEAHSRYSDRLTLMQSFVDVRNEGLLRKLFVFWHQTAHHRIRRRERLRRKMLQWRHSRLLKFYLLWRDALKESRLRPLEDAYYQGLYVERMLHIWKRWTMKTSTLPAIRFNSHKTKARVWRQWINEIPRAQQRRVAEETERRVVLAPFMKRWLTLYRAKMNRKAMARAMYFRASSASPKTPVLSRNPFAHTKLAQAHAPKLLRPSTRATLNPLRVPKAASPAPVRTPGFRSHSPSIPRTKSPSNTSTVSVEASHMPRRRPIEAVVRRERDLEPDADTDGEGSEATSAKAPLLPIFPRTRAKTLSAPGSLAGDRDRRSPDVDRNIPRPASAVPRRLTLLDAALLSNRPKRF